MDKEKNGLKYASREFVERLNSTNKKYVDNLNKGSKKDTFGCHTGVDGVIDSDVKYWVPTGVSLLDVNISNLLEEGGWPSNRISMIWGVEQSGKSLLAAHALASTQKMGGIAIYIDAEKSFDRDFARAIGVDVDNLVIYDKSTIVEAIFAYIMHYVETVRTSRHFEGFNDVPITIVLDSTTVLMTNKTEALNADKATSGYTGAALSAALAELYKRMTPFVASYDVCLIITSQARMKMNLQNMMEYPFKPAGGKSNQHYSSVIVRLTPSSDKVAKEDGIKRVVGRKIYAVVEKNRLGPPKRKCKFDIYFDRGADSLSSLEELAGKYEKYIPGYTKSGAWYKYEYVDESTGEVKEFRVQGWDNFAKQVLAPNPDILDAFQRAIFERYILYYKKSSADLELEDEEIIGLDG